MDSWPSWACTAGNGRPPRINQLAQVCRRSWMRGRFVSPASLARSTAGVHTFGVKLWMRTTPSGLRRPRPELVNSHSPS